MVGLELKLTIAGVDCTSMLQPGTLSITDELKTRSRCSFTLWDKTGEFYPDTGALVTIAKDEEIIYAGTIDEPTEEVPMGTEQGHYLTIRMVNYAQLCDRYHVRAVYTNRTCKQIITDALTSANHCRIYLEAIGVNEHVQDGPVIDKLVANWITVTELLNTLTRLSSYSWYIDYDKQLHFFDRETYTAPFEITDDEAHYRKFRVRRTRADYRNWQIVRGATSSTSMQVEPNESGYKGDGITRVFHLTYPVDTLQKIEIKRGTGEWMPVITIVQGTPIGQIEAWSYSKGSTQIAQESGSVLTDADRIRVTYIGSYPIIAQEPYESEIMRRQEVEGGGGIYEHIEIDDSIESQEVAKQQANRLLDVYGKIPREVSFETDLPGLAAGQQIRIALARYNIDDYFLIKRVIARDVSGKFMRYQVDAIGSETDTWVDFFRGLARRPKSLVAYENEVLLDLRNLKDLVSATDILTATPQVKPFFVSDYTFVGHAEVNNLEYYYIGPGTVAVAER